MVLEKIIGMINQIATLKTKNSNIGTQAIEFSEDGRLDQDNNYRYSFDPVSKDLLLQRRESGIWNIVRKDQQLEDDECLNIPNRGLTIGSPDSTKDTEFVVGKGDSTVVGMTIFTSPDDATFTDVTSIAASPSASTFPIFSNNPQVGATDYFGWEYPFCNFKLKVASVPVVGTGVVVREYWNGSAWVAFPAMVVDDATGEQRANNIGAFVGSEQVRFCFSDAAKTIVNGVNKYWIRFRVTSALTSSGTIEHIKMGPDRYEVERDGQSSYYGNAEYVGGLAIPFRALYNLQGSTPSNANITVSPNITVQGLSNKFSDNSKDGKVGNFIIPYGLDTSRQVRMTVGYFPDSANSGDIEFTLYTAQSKVGDIFDGTLAEVSQAKIESVNNEQYKWKEVFFDFDVESLVPGDALDFSFFRDATPGNANDTFTGGVVLMTNFAVRATFWRP